MQILLEYKDWLWLGFAGALIIYWILSFLILYHLIRFGVGTLPKKTAIVFLAGGIILSITTTLFFAQIFN